MQVRESEVNVIFWQAWENYQKLETRKHPIIQKEYETTFFTALRHRNRENIETHPAFQLVSMLDRPDLSELKARECFIHFLAHNPPANSHSFSSYLVDELVKHDPQGGWEWFEHNPVIRCETGTFPLYRGVKYDPEKAFSKGLPQHYVSDCISPYTASQNGGIGNSTSLNYGVAFDYAAPQKDYDPEVQKARRYCNQLTGSSYVYVIHYRGKKSIHIPNTQLARSSFFQYNTCRHEDEVNIAETIKARDLFCVIEVDRSSRLIKNIENNPHYVRDESTVEFENQYLSRSITLRDYNNSYISRLIASFHEDTLFSTLQALSAEFMRVKYSPDINSKMEVLEGMRNEALSEFLKFIEGIVDDKTAIRYIETAMKLKIFCEHKVDSVFTASFDTETKKILQACLIERNRTEIRKDNEAQASGIFSFQRM